MKMSIGRAIKLARIAVGMKQGELARRAGVTQNYLSILEGGKAGDPSVGLLRRIARVLRVPVHVLLMGEEGNGRERFKNAVAVEYALRASK